MKLNADTPLVTLDLAGAEPMVYFGDRLMHGVARADVEIEPCAIPVLVLRVNIFRVKGATVPHGIVKENE